MPLSEKKEVEQSTTLRAEQERLRESMKKFNDEMSRLIANVRALRVEVGDNKEAQDTNTETPKSKTF